MRKRVAGLVRSRALAAVVAQVWQAVGSFALQIIAAWLLGAAGLGLISLCLGIIILATALTSGMVGDSLVILDRHDRRIRGGLQVWALILAVTSMVVAGTWTALSGLLTPLQALLFAAALGAFQLEELVRRVFMATMHFWRLVVIDSTAVLCSLATIGISALVSTVGIATFFLGLLIGQLAGIVVGVAMLPVGERRLVSLRGAGIRTVAAFGSWRGAQVSVPPLVLTAARMVVTVAVGRAALGEVEAARIYVAPALLAVQGLGSYLLSSYVRDKASEVAVLKRRAWRASLVMMGAAALAGVALAFSAPMLGRFVTGPSFSVDQLAVAGWACYVAASASCQPFASLAAVRGRQVKVFICRSINASVAIAVLWVLLVPLGASASWTPFALAAGLLLDGVLVRHFVLRPLARAQAVPVRQLSPTATSVS